MEQSRVEEVWSIQHWREVSGIQVTRLTEGELESFHLFRIPQNTNDDLSLSFGWTPRVGDKLHSITPLRYNEVMAQNPIDHYMGKAHVHDLCIEGHQVREFILHLVPKLMAPMFVLAVAWETKVKVIGEMPYYELEDAMERWRNALYVVLD